MNISTEHPIGIILLAAGISSRLGEPKQLLRLTTGTSLVRHAAQLCIALDHGPVVVVTGAHSQQVESEVVDLPCTIVHNQLYQDGMGSSIAHGVQQLSDQLPRGYLIALVDQPYLTLSLLQQLVHKSTMNSDDIIVSKYDVGQGPPCYFPRKYETQLMALSGDQGARSIIQAHQEDVTFLSFPDGSKDVDVQADKIHLGKSNP